jgi:hypothetical protein
MPGYNSQRRGTARTSQFTSQFFFFLIFTCAPSSVFCVLFVCQCVLYYCHRLSTQLQLNNNNNNTFEPILFLCVSLKLFTYPSVALQPYVNFGLLENKGIWPSCTFTLDSHNAAQVFSLSQFTFRSRPSY